jgi:ubiquinone/menaquinone biosynthesis C-methylase UbiE
MQRPKKTHVTTKTSWEKVSSWYDQSVGKTGHYYHEAVILPNILAILDCKKETSILDLACGQGILSRAIPEWVDYTGIDVSSSLIQAAIEKTTNKNHKFHIADITKKLPVKEDTYTYCTIVLALQNIEHPVKVFLNAYKALKSNGKILIVLNHPCFRIPKYSSWGVDDQTHIQYRRMDRYYSSTKIPIAAHPSQGAKSAHTLSFHHPLSTWVSWLYQAGFVIEEMQEWCSDKKSTGKYAKREDFSRAEFPLFLSITASKK